MSPLQCSSSAGYNVNESSRGDSPQASYQATSAFGLSHYIPDSYWICFQPISHRVISHQKRTCSYITRQNIYHIHFSSQNPFTDNAELQQRSARMLSMNTWDVAVTLTNFDWSVFNSIHEVRDIIFCPSPTLCMRPNWHPIHYSAPFVFTRPIELWSKVVRYKGHRGPFGMQPCLFDEVDQVV